MPARFEAPTLTMTIFRKLLTVLGLTCISVAISLLVRPCRRSETVSRSRRVSRILLAPARDLDGLGALTFEEDHDFRLKATLGLAVGVESDNAAAVSAPPGSEFGRRGSDDVWEALASRARAAGMTEASDGICSGLLGYIRKLAASSLW